MEYVRFGLRAREFKAEAEAAMQAKEATRFDKAGKAAAGKAVARKTIAGQLAAVAAVAAPAAPAVTAAAVAAAPASARMVSAWSDDDDEGNEEEEEEEAGEAGERYRVIGTLSNAQAEKPAWVSEIVSAGDALRDALLGCSSVVYDITSNPSQVAAAVAAVELLAAAAADEVAGGAGGKSRTFVCLSSVLTWAKTKPADPEASAVRCAAFYGLHAACDSYLAWLLFPRAIPCTITRRPNCHAAPNTGTPIAGLPCCA